MSYKQEDATKVLDRIKNSFPDAYISKKGISLDHPNGTKELILSVPQEAFAPFATDGSEPELQAVTLVLKDFTAGDDHNPVTLSDIFVSATDSKGKPVSADVALKGVEISNELGERVVEATYTDGELDGEENSASAFATVTIETAIKEVTLELQNASGVEGTPVTLEDIFVGATDDNGEPLSATDALQGVTIPTSVGTHPITAKLTGRDIRGTKNEVEATCEVSIAKKISQVSLELKDFNAGDANNPVTLNDIFVSATNGAGQSVTADVALKGVVIPNTIGTHPISVTYTDGKIDGADNTVTKTCQVVISTSLKQVTLKMKNATVIEGTPAKPTDVFTSATDDSGGTLTADVALKGLVLPTAVGTHDLSHTLKGKDIRGTKNEATATAKLIVEKKINQVTLVLKDVSAGDDKNPVTLADIFTSATDGAGKPVSVDVALKGVTIPNTVGVHTVEATYTDGVLNDGKPNTVTKSCKVTITTALKQVTLVMKNATKEEGTAVTLADIFTSATDSTGKATTADVALKGVTIPTTVGTHTVNHTYKGTAIRGVKNEVAKSCTVTITKAPEPEPEPEVPEE